MKVKFTKVPQDSAIKAGERHDLTFTELDTLKASGHEFITEAEENLIAAREAAVDSAIKASKAFAPKEDTAEVRANAIALEERKAGSGVAYINSLPAKQDAKLGNRVTAADAAEHVVEIVEQGLRETVKGFIKACEPFAKEHRNGGIMRKANKDESALKDAIQASKARAVIGEKLTEMIKGGANFQFTNDLIQATYDGSADTNLGVLNTALTLQWNLGHLENQLPYLQDITTDISSTPVMFNQNARTRYIQVPKVQLKTSTNAWTAGAGTDVDVNVLMDTHAGVPITVNNNILGSTARQLMNEQKAPQLYGLGEYITYKLVNTIFNGSTRFANDGTTTSTITFNPAYTNTGGTHTFSVNGATLKTFVADLPEAMDESKFPGGDEEPGEEPMRFVWVHGRVYATAAADSNFLLNQSIQGIRQNTGENTIATGRFLRIGNTKFRKSQLVLDNTTVSGSGADATTNGISVTPGAFGSATYCGFAGTRSSLLFVSRVPLDYTKVLPEIPSTAAVELVTSPKLGITFMVVKYLDHAYETANMRVQLMFGQAIGDERQGMLLTTA